MITLLLLLGLSAGAPDHRGAGVTPGDEAVATTQPAEETVGEFIEYRCLPELGQITISDGVVRGRKPVAHLRSHGKELAARGIFPCTDREHRKSYRRVEELNGHKFETLIVIVPPAEADGDFTRRLTVRVDGRKKLDCSVGNSPGDDIFVYGVTIFPDDGTIEVAAVDADGAELFPPAELELIDNPGVITDDTLAPDPGEEEDMEKPLERA
jgi:hypothetical protein